MLKSLGAFKIMKFKIAQFSCSRNSENIKIPIDSHVNFVIFACQKPTLKFKRLQFLFAWFHQVQTYFYIKFHT